MRYEVEIRGYLPFRGVFDSIYYELYTKRLDIAGSHTFCNDEESLIRYMIAICVSFIHLKDDPRCPVHIDNLPSFSAISVNGEDDSPSMLNSSVLFTN